MPLRKKGMVLALVLVLSVIVMVLGMAFIGSRAVMYQNSARLGEAAQARALAEAGLEDCRIKLDKDPGFPPPGREEQTKFSYSEDVTDSSGELVGYYEVTVDSSHAVGPYYVVRIDSVGRAGTRAEPVAQHTIEAELDVAVEDRASPGSPNPRHFRFLRWDSSQNP